VGQIDAGECGCSSIEKVVDCKLSHVGCAELKRAVNRVKPRVHVFGHVHEGYGVLKQQPTTFINACSVNRAYKPVNKPIVFDLV